MSGPQSGQKEPLGCNEGKCSRCNKREHQDVVKESVDEKPEQRVTQELVSKTTSKIYVPVGCGKRLSCEEKKKFKKKSKWKGRGAAEHWAHAI